MIFANTFANILAIEKGDNPKNFSDFYPRAIAVDASGHPHIVYGGDHLYYTYYDGNSWRYETVDKLSDVGKYASLALDTSGKAHISYYDNTNGDLKYATNSSGDWTTAIVANSGGEYTSIALDRAGKAHISYYSGFLWYATNASGSWITEAVDSGIIKGQYNSIALDKSGNAHISYYYYERFTNNGYLMYATNASGSWSTETMDDSGDVDGYTSIALDSSDKVHISYQGNGLKHTTNTSGLWVTETVDSSGGTYYTSIALDSSDKVHVSYYTGVLKYATNTSGSWVTETVDSSGGVYPSIALDSSDKAHISYYTGGLKYATNTSGSWVTETVDNGICIPALIIVSPDKLSIKVKGSEEVIVTARGENGCLIEGETVNVKMTKSAKKKISVSPEEGGITDANGETVFTLTGKKKGIGKVTFEVNGLKEKITVMVKKK